jgi:hypothetical protein
MDTNEILNIVNRRSYEVYLSEECEIWMKSIKDNSPKRKNLNNISKDSRRPTNFHSIEPDKVESRRTRDEKRQKIIGGRNGISRYSRLINTRNL